MRSTDNARGPGADVSQDRRDPRAAGDGASPVSAPTRPGSRGMIGLQRRAGNRAVAAMVRSGTGPARSAPVALARSVVLGPEDASERLGDGAGPAPATQDVPGVSGIEDVGVGGGGAGGEAPPAGPPADADGATSEGPDGSGDPGGDGAGAVGDAPPDPLTPADLDPTTATLVADLDAVAASDPAPVRGPAAHLLTPQMRRAAARHVPDRAEELTGAVAQRVVARSASRTAAVGSRRSAPVVQRDGTGTLPTRKIKVALDSWQPVPLFTDRNVGSWFLLSGAIESPAWEGEAKPPDHLRDDTLESEVQLAAEGGVTGYSATLHKEVLGKVGTSDLEGKVAVETTTKGVKVSGLSLKLPDLGGDSAVLLQGEFNFDLLEWPVGQPPGVMVLSYTQKIGTKSSFVNDGWTYTGALSLPIKVSIKPSPAKVAEFVGRTLGPRLAAAAPAGLAIAAPLAAGAVCFALWANAVQTGEEIAAAIDYAGTNTRGYTSGYVGTIFGWKSIPSNAGATRGAADAQAVLTRLRFDELSEGAKAEVRSRLENTDLGVAAAERRMWGVFRGTAIADYRRNHPTDAWCYDHGLPSDLHSLIRSLDATGPPWSVSRY